MALWGPTYRHLLIDLSLLSQTNSEAGFSSPLFLSSFLSLNRVCTHTGLRVRDALTVPLTRSPIITIQLFTELHC